MSHRVPYFMLEDDSPAFAGGRIPDASVFSPGDPIYRPRREDIAELLRRKGPVFHRGPPDFTNFNSGSSSGIEPFASSGATSQAAATAGTPGTFTEEDEMASWLCNPPVVGDDDPGGTGGLLGGWNTSEPLHVAPAGAVAERTKVEADGWPGFGQPSLHPGTAGGGRTAGSAAPAPQLASRESTVVDSNSTLDMAVGRRRGGGAEPMVEAAKCDRGLASSSGVSGGEEADGKAVAMSAAGSKVRKRRAAAEDEEFDSHSEDAEFEPAGSKRGELKMAASARRARAAEVHNLSERRRRDKINEKMKALQQLIPGCNKMDKASMLDDAIEYIKSLQMQVQMMYMCYSIAPMMSPAGVQQYLPTLGTGIQLGWTMGMAPGSLPMVPFTAVMPSALMAANSAAHMGWRVPPQSVHPPAAAVADQARLQVNGQADPAASHYNLPGHPHQNPLVTDSGAGKGSMPEKIKLG